LREAEPRNDPGEKVWPWLLSNSLVITVLGLALSLPHWDDGGSIWPFANYTSWPSTAWREQCITSRGPFPLPPSSKKPDQYPADTPWAAVACHIRGSEEWKAGEDRELREAAWGFGQ
jgi:hypothetical protein